MILFIIQNDSLLADWNDRRKDFPQKYPEINFICLRAGQLDWIF